MPDTVLAGGTVWEKPIVIERHGSLILLFVGCALVAGGVLSVASEAQIGLCGIGASLVVLAVVLTQTEGRLKVGPAGVETNLRRSASERAQNVADSLAANGLDSLIALAGSSPSLDNAQTGQIRQAVASLIETLERLDAAQEQDEEDKVPATVLLEAAHGLMATREWANAARYFDRYVELAPDNWDAQFSRAVAHANSRLSRESDLAALRAFSEAIALRPALTSSNSMARLFSYRGAMLKRLGRLAEAEADLRLAVDKATKPAEVNDARYNLACVLAMKGHRRESLELVRSLRGTPYIEAIRAKRHEYFDSLANHAEFLALLSPNDR